eukprot:scaffold80843_cov33-Phaeocystis_antarctica.AAC.1
MAGKLDVRELGSCLQSLGIDTTHSEAEHALQALTMAACLRRLCLLYLLGLLHPSCFLLLL